MAQVFGYSNPECIAIVDPMVKEIIEICGHVLHTEVPINTEKPIGHCSRIRKIQKTPYSGTYSALQGCSSIITIF